MNLAAIPKELVESALFGHEKGRSRAPSGNNSASSSWPPEGRLFLDEIGDLKYELQAKLLRAIQEGDRTRRRHASDQDRSPAHRRHQRRSRKGSQGRPLPRGFIYRLNVIPIRMPALRDRMEDLPELARFFLRRYNIKFRKNVQGIAESTLDILSSSGGRETSELENLIERLVAVSDKDWITDEDLPYELRGETRYTGSGGDGSARAGALDLRAQLHRARSRSRPGT